MLNVCEAWSLTLRKEHRLIVSENRLPMREEVVGGASWFVLLTKYYSDAEIKEDEMGGACGTYGNKFYKLFGGKPEGKRLLGRTCDKWEGNIEMSYVEIVGWVWTRFIWLRLRKLAGSFQQGK